MANVWRISEAATMALHTIVFLAAHDERLYSTREIATAHEVSEAHLSKVLQRLAKVGLVNSVRGPKGGFLIGRPADEIKLIEIYESIDGPLTDATCLLGKPVCTGGQCIMCDVVEKVNREAKTYLSGTTVADVAAAYGSEDNNGQKHS
jgi:Rrf2 family protein